MNNFHDKRRGMYGQLTAEKLAKLKGLLYSYFPDVQLNDDFAGLLGKDESEILHLPRQILPCLQTVFFEEHLLEVQIDETDQIFFAHIVDDIPALKKQKTEFGTVMVEPEYEAGSYLKKVEYFLITPLTPGVGNARIRTSKKVIARFFCGTIAIEMGCTFLDTKVVRDVPVIRLDFPIIARVNRSYRSYRVKAISTVDAKVFLRQNSSESDDRQDVYQIVDLSAFGLAFQLLSEMEQFKIGEVIDLTVKVAETDPIDIKGDIRHISKVRDRHGYKIICGLRFDPETMAQAAKIEQVAAMVQRLKIRQLAKKTSKMSDIEIIGQ